MLIVVPSNSRILTLRQGDAVLRSIPGVKPTVNIPHIDERDPKTNLDNVEGKRAFQALCGGYWHVVEVRGFGGGMSICGMEKGVS